MADLARDGYTLIEAQAARDMAEMLRCDIVELAKLTQGPLHGRASALLLGRRPSFAQALCQPDILAIVEALLGKGASLSQMVGSIRVSGSPGLGLHADNSWFPEPFPEWEMSCTACWVLDEFTERGGCTFAVPGSHLQRRHPPDDQRAKPLGAVSLEAQRGSIWLWTGALWHGSSARTVLGERVALHMTFNRLGIQPIEDYRHLNDEWLRSQPDEIARLLGRQSHFGTTTLNSGGVDPFLAVETYRAVHGRDGY